MIKTLEERLTVAGAELAMIKAGSGKPLLIFHDELGYPGWMTWNERAGARSHAAHSAAAGLRQDAQARLGDELSRPGGLLLASRARAEARSGRRHRLFGWRIYCGRDGRGRPAYLLNMVLVAPMGIKPEEGEIMDIFPITMRTHLRATVADPAGTPEFLKMYGGEMTPEQFEAFEDARAESARIGWEPYMHNPALPHLLRGIKLRRCWCGEPATGWCRADVSTPTRRRYRGRRSRRSKMSVIGRKLKTQPSSCE